ncbi:cation diffusion facilitator family transporter [Nocardioides bigeumensis]|uniref:Cation transporter n=1 Tax=Nocardioides bigeumensis TaxID=433657 RepID=A0ABP5K7D6_9ACTN
MTVVIAFLANLAVGVAKTVAAVMTGSASLTAEAAHSWADAGNQILLLVADRRSKRRPDESRPWGYGREAYIWSLLAALGLFVAGGIFSAYHGITQLRVDEPGGDYLVGYVVLAVALCFESVSLAQALRQTRREASGLGRDLLDHALATSDPTLRAVLAEDSAAVVGIVVAAAGLALHEVTGNAVYDAIGSIVVGVLLCGVAAVLVDRNRRFLLGQVVDPAISDAIRQRLLELPDVVAVDHLRVEFVGPRQLVLLASVDLAGDRPESRIAIRLEELARRLEEDASIVDAVLVPSAPAGA